MSDLRTAYLIDMDGVLYRGNRALPGAQAFMGRLARRGCPYMLVTNESAFTGEEIHARLQGMGISVSPSSIYTSAMATAAWVKEHMAGKSVMLVGERSLHAAFREAGIGTTEEEPECIVIGEMVRLDAPTLARAAGYAARGVPVIGTNPDLFIPGSESVRLGCGAVSAIFEKVSGKAPTFVGKPEPHMFEYAMATLGVARERVVVIGDNMRTDILGAHRLGLRSILVLTGVTQPGDLDSFPFRPTRVVSGLDEVEQ